MPVRIIGMIGVTPPTSDAALHVIEGGLSTDYLVKYARAHDDAGFDLALVGYSSSSAEGFLVALHAANHTKTLGYLVAHRPGFVAPTLMARKIATFDHLTNGRLAVHIITGKTDDEQDGDGDFSPKVERYSRAAEYLELMKHTWLSEKPFDFSGEFYQVKGAASDVRPLQQPHPLLFFGGASDGALKWAQNFATSMPSTPSRSNPRATASRASAPRRRRSGGRSASTCRFARSSHRRKAKPGTRPTGFWRQMTGKKGWSRQEDAAGPVDNAGKRLMSFADQDIHDERLWMPIARVTGALGNTSCLVGTPEQVAESILKYYVLGVDSFLIRGFDPFNDTVEFGRELIPRIKAGAIEIDRRRAAE